MELLTKTCTKCKGTKEIDEFGKRKQGLVAWCKVCLAEYQKHWYEEKKRLRDAEKYARETSNPVTAKVCRKCLVFKPFSDFQKYPRGLYGFRSWCILCMRSDNNTRRNKDPVAANAAARAIYYANHERARKSVREWRQNNKDKFNQYSRNWRAKNPELHLKYVNNWKEQNPVQAAAIVSAAHAKRRARLHNAVGKYTPAEIVNLFALQKGKCACCKCKLGKFDADHIMPLALGGSNEITNIQLLCPRCNNKKWAKHPIDFMREHGFLL